jgi:DNA mismatch repair protein MutS2
MGTMGTLLSDPADTKRPPEVLVGTMRMKMNWENLEPVEAEKPKAGSRPYATSSDYSDAPTELHLIGKKVEEAKPMLEGYLDRAARSGRPFVRIVHGHGSGALRKMVREVLKSSGYEMKFRAGTPNEGGEGCTVVEFI